MYCYSINYRHYIVLALDMKIQVSLANFAAWRQQAVRAAKANPVEALHYEQSEYPDLSKLGVYVINNSVNPT